MSTVIIDARGLSCPQPVVLTHNAITAGKTDFTVVVDNLVSKENVLRCIQKNGLQAEIQTEGDEYRIRVNR